MRRSYEDIYAYHTGYGMYDSAAAMTKRHKTDLSLNDALPPPSFSMPGPPSSAPTTPTSATTELCRDFAKGRCARGSACKYLHVPQSPLQSTSPAAAAAAMMLPPLAGLPPLLLPPPTTQSTSAAAAASPYYYPYYYNDPQYSQYYAKMYEQLALYRPEPVKDPTKLEYIACRDFLNNKCTHGEDCKYAHVVNAATLPKGALYQCLTRCGDFHNNNCNRENCKYAHIINAKQLEERHKRLLNMSSSGSSSRSRYCQDFRRGKCTRGASCKYSHAEELCRDYNRGECRLAPEQCRYVHKLYSEVGQVDPLKQKRTRSSSHDEQHVGTASPSKLNNTTTTISSDGVM